MRDNKKLAYDEIDWEDDSGITAFRELEKRNKIREKIGNDVNKVAELSPEEWILLLLYSNDGVLTKTLIIKLACIFSERTGLSELYIFSYHYHQILSDVIERALRYLILTDKLFLEIQANEEGYVCKTYKIKDKTYAKSLWNLLPNSIIEVIQELRHEFGIKSIYEVNLFVDYVNDAYPEYGAYRELIN